jgi:hypothetical protein
MKIDKVGFVDEGKKYSDEDKYEDIICDICQSSCKISAYVDESNAQFHNLEIKGAFGFGSHLDGEYWTADICDKCSETFLEKIVCFKKIDYLTMGSSSKADYKTDYHDFLNERATRIRKIRKLTGDVEFKIVPKKEED